MVLRLALARLQGDEPEKLIQETHKVKGELDALIDEVAHIGESVKGFKTDFTDDNI